MAGKLPLNYFRGSLCQSSFHKPEYNRHIVRMREDGKMRCDGCVSATIKLKAENYALEAKNAALDAKITGCQSSFHTLEHNKYTVRIRDDGHRRCDGCVFALSNLKAKNAALEAKKSALDAKITGCQSSLHIIERNKCTIRVHDDGKMRCDDCTEEREKARAKAKN